MRIGILSGGNIIRVTTKVSNRERSLRLVREEYPINGQRIKSGRTLPVTEKVPSGGDVLFVSIHDDQRHLYHIPIDHRDLPSVKRQTTKILKAIL